MQVDRDAPERAAPFHHCRVEVRMRDSDSLQATEPVDQGSGRRVQHRNAVPQDISIGCGNNQRTLADRKLWLCANADYSRNVLPLFFANYALPRRDTARRVLGAAGSANERFHITVPGTRALCTLIIDRPRPTSLGFTSRKTRNGVSATPRSKESLAVC